MAKPPADLASPTRRGSLAATSASAESTPRTHFGADTSSGTAALNLPADLLFPGLNPDVQYIPAGPFDRSLDIAQMSPAHLSFNINLLRPMETVASSDTEVVLFVKVDAEREASLTVRWTLSAGDIEDLLEGNASIPVRFLDLRDLLTDGTSGEQATP